MPSPLLLLPAAIGLVQGLTGLFKGDAAAEEAKRLRASRRAFKTSDQVYDIVNETKNRAQTGYDVGTLDYLTNQIDRAASSAYGTAERLGADANDLSALFDQQLQATMKVGAENNALNMESFSKYIGAEELLSKNLDAEWASQQGMIKDDLQAAGQARQEAAAQVSNGLGNIGSGISAFETAKLYEDRTNALKNSAASVSAGAPAGNNIYQPDSLPNPLLTQTIPNAIQSVSQIVTPESNFTRGRTRIVGFDEFGEPIYR